MTASAVKNTGNKKNDLKFNIQVTKNFYFEDLGCSFKENKFCSKIDQI
jgi:hypothetical protein